MADQTGLTSEECCNRGANGIRSTNSDTKAITASPNPGHTSSMKRGRPSPRVAGGWPVRQQHEGQRNHGHDGRVRQNPEDHVRQRVSTDDIGEAGDPDLTLFVLGENRDGGRER